MYLNWLRSTLKQSEICIPQRGICLRNRHQEATKEYHGGVGPTHTNWCYVNGVLLDPTKISEIFFTFLSFRLTRKRAQSSDTFSTDPQSIRLSPISDPPPPPLLPQFCALASQQFKIEETWTTQDTRGGNLVFRARGCIFDGTTKWRDISVSLDSSESDPILLVELFLVCADRGTHERGWINLYSRMLFSAILTCESVEALNYVYDGDAAWVS